uniref:Transposase Tc1-like domain-containing protein n=1 Tax=Myripristis murdjan TaxID=586833 RepID=A0A667WHT7_9TELE
CLTVAGHLCEGALPPPTDPGSYTLDQAPISHPIFYTTHKKLQQRYRETGRVTERHRSGHPLATSHTDDRFIVNSALWNRMMNATQLQARLREVRGTQVSCQTIRNRLHQHGLRARRPARVPDHTTRHRCHRLAWAREHLRWTRDQWALMKADSYIKESTMHHPLLSPDEPLVVVVLLCGQVCLVSTELPYTL